MKDGFIFYGWAFNKSRKLVRKSILGKPASVTFSWVVFASDDPPSHFLCGQFSTRTNRPTTTREVR
jgi:hypothetical protein